MILSNQKPVSSLDFIRFAIKPLLDYSKLTAFAQKVGKTLFLALMKRKECLNIVL